MRGQSALFGPTGGTIGRAGDCTWTLPDPERFLSSQHIRIEYRDGAYVLSDTSTNGVVFNDAAAPLGRGSSVRLRDGDVVSLCGYRLEVSLIPAGSSAMAPAATPAAQAAAGAAPAPDSPRSAARASDGQHLCATPTPTPTPVPAGRQHPGGAAATPASMPRGRPDSAVSRTGSTAGDDSGLALSLGLGGLSDEQRAALPPLVARVVQDAVAGIMKLLTARNAIKSEYRVPVTTLRPVENNPLKFSVSPQEALVNMFERPGRAFLPPVEAVNDAFDDLVHHQLAMLAGMRAAFEHMLEGFDPALLEQSFEQDHGRLDRLMGKKRDARYWDSYRAHYQALTEDREQAYQRLFAEEFIRAYELQLAKLEQQRGQ